MTVRVPRRSDHGSSYVVVFEVIAWPADTEVGTLGTIAASLRKQNF